MKLQFFFFACVFFPMLIRAQTIPLFRVTIDEINGITPKREQEMRLAASIFEKVMNDTVFQKEVAEFAYEYDVANDPNRGLTPVQVANKLFDGAESYKLDRDNVANIHWIIEKKKKPRLSRHPARGYGKAENIQIFTYTWFFDGSLMQEIVGHLAHEWSHKIGFIHLFDSHPGRENTVPYAFGKMVEKHAQKYIKQ